MLTYAALTTVAGQDLAQTVASAIEAMMPEPTAVGVTEVEDGSGLYEVGAYFTDPPDLAGFALIEAAFALRPFVVSEVPDQDWVAHVRRELAPVQAGRFWVHGSHDADTVPPDTIPLLIEAAMAFGTGHHGTTLGCLRAIDRLATQGVVAQNVVDIGCGTAVLAMAAAQVFPNPVLASDIDPVAVEVAAANVAANGLTGRVRCVEAAGFDAPVLAAAAPFDLILANILKGPLVALAPQMARHAAPGAWVILSGLLVEQADDIVAAYAENGINLVSREDIVDWTTLTLSRIR